MAAKSNLINMVCCLGAVCLVCAALLGGVYVLTEDAIAQTNAALLRESVGAVLPAGGTLSEALPLEVGGTPSEYYVSTADGAPAGYAVKSTVSGFGGPLVLMVGLTPEGKVYGTSVLSHAETPGLGAKCTSDAAFIDQFKGFDPAVSRLAVRKDGGDVDAITASTITSRAYALAIANAVAAFQNIKGE